MKLYNPYSGLRGLPATVWIVFATTLVNRAGMMALPFLVLYLTRHLHVTAALAGLAVSAYGVGGFVIAPMAGRLADRVGAFTVLRGSLAFTGLILFVIPLLHAYALILLATFAWGMAADAARPATMSALANSVAPDKRAAAIAVHRLAMNIGSSIGPAVGGFLAVASFPLLFIVDGMTTLIAAATLSFMLFRHGRDASIPMRDPVNVSHATSAVPRSSVWRDPRALALIAAAFLVNFVYTQDLGALPLHIVRDLGYRESFFGSLFLLNTIIIVAIEVPLNLSMTRWPAWRTCALAALLIAAGYGMMVFAHAPLPIMFTVVVWTFGEMMFYPTVTSAMADAADAADSGRTGRTGEYMGALSAAMSLAVVLGPWAGSALLDSAGATPTWILMFVVGVAGAVLITLTRARPIPAGGPR